MIVAERRLDLSIHLRTAPVSQPGEPQFLEPLGGRGRDDAQANMIFVNPAKLRSRRKQHDRNPVCRSRRIGQCRPVLRGGRTLERGPPQNPVDEFDSNRRLNPEMTIKPQ